MKRQDIIRIKYFIYCLFHRDGYSHAEYLKKHKAFKDMGENCFFQPFNLPADAEYIRFGSNVVVAANASFICHDVINCMLNHAPGYSDGYTTYWGTIDIKDNVFIGSNATILPNVIIGSDTVIAAGALVNKNVPDGKIVAGVPAKAIGETAELAQTRKKYSESSLGKMKRNERLAYLWNKQEEK